MNFRVWRPWKQFVPVRSNSDLEDELRVHLELTAEENIASGMSDAEARRRAQLQLGRKSFSIIESIRDREPLTALESCYQDLIFAFRALRKNPIFCITSVLTLALGIGANTAVFSVLYGLLLRSLPVENPSRLVRLGLNGPAFQPHETGMFLTYPMFKQLSKQQRSFTEISAWATQTVTTQDREGTIRLYSAGLVSGNAFAALQLKPYIGRFFNSSDDLPGAPSSSWPVVLSYGYWESRFGGDPGIIGKHIEIADRPATIIGIAPAAFHGIWPGMDQRLYLPFQFLNVLAGRDVLNSPSAVVGCSVIARLKPGVSIRDANPELSVYKSQLLNTIPLEYRQLPWLNNAGFEVQSARTGLPTFFGYTYSQPLFLLEGLVGIVLVLCCVNVGGLMLSKLYARQREFAVRIGIGAARWRLIRQYLIESLLIAAAGAVLGAAGAWYGAVFLLQFFRHPNMFEGMSVQPDISVFWITGGLAVMATLLFGSLPAWRAGQSDPGILLRSRTVLGSRKQIAGRAFVPIQVAFSITLVALATLLSQSLMHLRGEPTGFDLNHVTIQTPPFMGPQKGDAKLDLYQRMVDRIAELPDVRSAAVTWYTPMTGEQSMARFQAVSPNPNQLEGGVIAYNAVGPGYFRTMRTAILSGREFAKNERQDTVCILNQSAASYLFPHESALGQYVRSNDIKAFGKRISCRVVGIAQDAKFANLRDPPPRTLYFPVSTRTIADAGALVFLINSETKAQAIAAYRKALKEIVPSTPLVLFVTLREQMDAALGSQRLLTAMSNFFAGIALLLSAVGLYGLLSSSISERTGEIGVRMALGAQHTAVLRMVLSEAMRLLTLGITVGAVLLLLTVHFVKSMLYEISEFDPLTLAGTIVLLSAVTLIAAICPALRAASVDPIEALRVE